MSGKRNQQVFGMRIFNAWIVFIVMIFIELSFSCSDSQESAAEPTSEIKNNFVSDNNIYSKKYSGDFSRLSAEEIKTHLADGQYIRSLVPPGKAVHLNMADPRQRQFMMTRLKVAGKNARNSPYLFELLAQRKAESLLASNEKSLIPLAAVTLEDGEEEQEEEARERKHYIPAYGTNNEDQTGYGVAATTYPNGTDYTYLDVGYFDKYGYPLADVNIVEEFDGGAAPVISVNSDLTKTSLKSYVVDSNSYEIIDDRVEYTYIYKTLGTDDPVTEPPKLGVSVEHPRDVAYNDRKVSVCLNRTWTQDCDYDLTADPLSVKMPFAGEVSITSNDHVFDWGELSYRQINIDEGLVGPEEYGSIILKLNNDGGACSVLHGSMLEFWRSLRISDDKRTLTWDLTGNDKALTFSDACRMVQDETTLDIVFEVPVTDTSYKTHFTESVSISSNQEVNPQFLDFRIPRITFVNSCLAAGTMVEMVTGQLLPIEAIEAGAKIANPYFQTSNSLTVADTAKGFETQAMVSILDESGRSLLMTEMHPILVEQGGMTLAKNLAVGDVVMTKDGPSKLVQVERQSYDGKVYNLKVGSPAERVDIEQDQTMFYANGFLVGDGQIQAKYEMAELTKKEGNILERLPKKLHRDYQIFAGSAK